MAVHTKAPWHFEAFEDGAVWIMDADGNYLFEVVCQDDDGKCSDLEHLEANMKLAAAAPDMLAALKEALIKLEVFRANTTGEYQGGMEFSSLRKMVEKAIAKAEGKDG